MGLGLDGLSTLPMSSAKVQMEGATVFSRMVRQDRFQRTF